MLHKEAQLGEGLGVPSGAVWLGLRVALTGEDIQGPVDVGLRQPLQTSRKSLDRSGCNQTRLPRLPTLPHAGYLILRQ